MESAIQAINDGIAMYDSTQALMQKYPKVRSYADAVSRGAKRKLGDMFNSALSSRSSGQSITSPASSRVSKTSRKSSSKGPVRVADSSGQKRRAMPRRGRVKRPKSAFTKLKRKVARLSKKVGKENWANHKYTAENVGQVSTPVNRCAYGQFVICNAASIEGWIDKYTYISTSAPATKASYDASAIPFPTRTHMNVRSKIVAKNNYIFPCDISVYICKPNIATSTTITSQMALDIGFMEPASVTNPYSTPLHYPSTDPNIHKYWNIKALCTNMRLNPGDEMLHYVKKSVTYDQEEHDLHAVSYEPGNTWVILIRINGVVCHDTTTPTNVGFSEAKIDVYYTQEYSMKIPSAMPIRVLEVVDNQAAITNADVAGVYRPVV